jgi:hypothetical protein
MPKSVVHGVEGLAYLGSLNGICEESNPVQAIADTPDDTVIYGASKGLAFQHGHDADEGSDVLG